MRIPTFIGVASLLLGGWLGVAFFRDVPLVNYPVVAPSLAVIPVADGEGAVALMERNVE